MLNADRETPLRNGDLVAVPVAAGARIYAGALVVARPAGYAAPGSAAAGLICLGRADEPADNTDGAHGAVSVQVRRRGAFLWNNAGGADKVGPADVGKPCFIVDDETVAKTDRAGTRSRAGVVVSVGADGVWVDVAAGRALAAAKELDFANIAAGAKADKTIPVPGAAVGDAVALGLPAAPAAGLAFQAFVSAANTVTVRAANYTGGAINPAAAAYRVAVVPA